MHTRLTSVYNKFGQPLLSNFHLNHPETQLPSSAAAFVLLEWHERFVFIKRRPHHKHTGWERFWWFPGGGVEPGESLEAAAIRECKEETGLDVRLTELLLTRICQGRQQWLAVFFRGEVLGGKMTVLNDPDQSTADACCRSVAELQADDFWSDMDKILLAKVGLIDYPFQDLLHQHGLHTR